MKCIYCGRDAKYKERTSGKCPGCSKRFAFEPKKGDRFTDPAFKAAIDAVSAKGQVRWGVEHLFYELCRRLARQSSSWGRFTILALLFVLGSALLLNAGRPGLIFILLLIGLGIWWLKGRNGGPTTVRLAQSDFDAMWSKWLHAHGKPPGLIVRKATPAPRRTREADIADYSFDRAVICDRARTVDLLIANNFHFENNCAVLSIGGYPEGPFEVVRTMLRRNPKLQVFALHDASVAGCQLAFKLANDDAWFKGHATLTDVGLRPRHATPFRGLLQPAAVTAHLTPRQGILADEIDWLNAYALELAAIRPEQILKRLFKAINRRESASDSATGDSGSSSSSSGDDGGGGSVGPIGTGGASGGGGGGAYYSDDTSFGADAGDSDGGPDSFG